MTKKLTPQEAGLLGGRPPKPIDYPKLEALCKIQCTGEECAAVLGCSYEHLNNTLIADGHGGFLDYYKRHSEGGKASLRRLQWKGAEAGNTTMLIWLGKQYLGQSDKNDIAHTSPDGSMSPVPAIDALKLSTSALVEILAAQDQSEK